MPPPPPPTAKPKPTQPPATHLAGLERVRVRDPPPRAHRHLGRVLVGRGASRPIRPATTLHHTSSPAHPTTLTLHLVTRWLVQPSPEDLRWFDAAWVVWTFVADPGTHADVRCVCSPPAAFGSTYLTPFLQPLDPQPTHASANLPHPHQLQVCSELADDLQDDGMACQKLRIVGASHAARVLHCPTSPPTLPYSHTPYLLPHFLCTSTLTHVLPYSLSYLPSARPLAPSPMLLQAYSWV